MATFDLDNEPFDEAGLARHIEQALAVEAPSGVFHDAVYFAIRRLFKPTLVHADKIPDEPCLFIGNHSLFALDGAVLAPVMLREQGRFLRALGDRFLWQPALESRLLELGAVLGHPQVCTALMEAGEDLMVFPGGAHEATKTAAQKYTLQWKERYGFVRMAALHGYTIMPMAIVGPDEFYNHLLEGEDLPDSRVGQLLQRLGLLTENTRTDILAPIPAGALGSWFPKPQHCYVQFGEPVSLAQYKGRKLTKKTLKDLRGEIASQIEEMLGELLKLREQRRGQDGLLRRLLTL